MIEGSKQCLTSEQFDKLVLLIEAAAYRAVVNARSNDPDVINMAQSNFEKKKNAARAALVSIM
ncbi:MAG TPA: hypothetical protein VED40_20605 [Azospirillaceae bacterium]|nr:hypothetical protein [Azospirillaceae bacterium]